jgi:hypothetical protein
VALGPGWLVALAELTGLEMGATELLVGGTVPTARSAGFTEGAGPVEAGVGFVTVPGGPTADDGPGLGAGEVVTAAEGRSFISSRRSPLWVLPLCA